MVICSHIYQRYQLFQSLESNAPGKLQPIHNLGLYEIRFADQVRNCEDVLLLEDSPGWALLSCDAGRDKWNTVMVRLVYLSFFKRDGRNSNDP